MKSEVKPGIIAGIVIVLILAIVGLYVILGGGLGEPEKIDVKTLDPKMLRDEDPPRRGNPNSRGQAGN